MGNSPLTSLSLWGGEQSPTTTTTKRQEISSFFDSKKVVEWLVGRKGGKLPEGFGSFHEVDILMKELSICNRLYLKTVCNILCPPLFLEKITRVAARKRRPSQPKFQPQEQRQRRRSQPTIQPPTRAISFPPPFSPTPSTFSHQVSPSSTPNMPSSPSYPSSSPSSLPPNPAEQRLREEERETSKVIEEGLSSLIAAKKLLLYFSNDHLDCLTIFLDSARFDESQVSFFFLFLFPFPFSFSFSFLFPFPFLLIFFFFS